MLMTLRWIRANALPRLVLVALIGFTFLSLSARTTHAQAGSTPLTIRFVTGGDDLRGGNDNVHVVFLQRTGGPLRFTNVNRSANWGNNSTNDVSITVPTDVGNLVGLQIETTFGGGLGGDNWNLDRLKVDARVTGSTRTILDVAGGPLVRFTGDVRSKQFPLVAGPIPPSPPVMTSFEPAKHGFHFVNSFKNIFVSQFDWFTGGLCGGMSYAALDYFLAKRAIPSQDFMPAEGTPFQSYLYNRQVNSLVPNADKWAELMFNPNGARNREFFTWGLQVGSGRLGELQDALARGTPVPLGLMECGADCRCVGKCPGSHQVLAIGYKLGRYAGDPAEHSEDLEIYVYDPNHPGSMQTLKADVRQGWYYYKENVSAMRWRAYFVDRKYGAVSPPSFPENQRALLVECATGGDDLRGGNDNLNLVVLRRNGSPLRFPNVNNGARWINNSSQSIARVLPEGVSAADITGVRLETTFGGGIGGDNWNLDRLTVRVQNGTGIEEVLSKSGSPLFRFTGDQRAREFMR